MIQVEYFATLENGDILNRTYSDAGFLIEREGVLYCEAVDPAKYNRQYTETDIPIETPEEEPTEETVEE